MDVLQIANKGSLRFLLGSAEAHFQAGIELQSGYLSSQDFDSML